MLNKEKLRSGELGVPYGDLVVVLLVELATVLMAYRSVSSSAVFVGVRVAVGLMAEIVIQGYLVVSIVYPVSHDIRTSLRWTLILVVSTVMVILEALLLSVLGTGFTTQSQSVLQFGVVVPLSLILVVRRRRLVDKTGAYGILGSGKKWTLSFSAVLVSVGVVVAWAVTPNFTQSPPALFLTDPSGSIQGFPYQVVKGTTFDLRLHVANPMASRAGYILLEQIDSDRLVEVARLSLGGGQSWTDLVTVPSIQLTGRVRLAFQLRSSLNGPILREVWIYYYIQVGSKRIG